MDQMAESSIEILQKYERYFITGSVIRHPNLINESERLWPYEGKGNQRHKK